ncbi:VF530 family DNA-binding protein [Paludibacterium yongneupense]|uniref:VF530 family protein n=1 Tax=Paludibacterium yongneupense TaxID=400061 RepID=UPI0003F95A2A|nr:VF530 family protein [Paludibacterium yongneupense]
MKSATKPDPLHGKTLQAIVTALVDYYGWDALAGMLDIRCFTHDPSIASSLKFLRRTPWARERVEQIYLGMLRERPQALVFGKKDTA